MGAYLLHELPLAHWRFSEEDAALLRRYYEPMGSPRGLILQRILEGLHWGVVASSSSSPPALFLDPAVHRRTAIALAEYAVEAEARLARAGTAAAISARLAGKGADPALQLCRRALPPLYLWCGEQRESIDPPLSLLAPLDPGESALTALRFESERYAPANGRMRIPGMPSSRRMPRT